MGGSLGMAAVRVVIAGQAALDNDAPLITVAAARVRMQVGILWRCNAAHNRLSSTARAYRPYIVIPTDPTTGGVTGFMACWAIFR